MYPRDIAKVTSVFISFINLAFAKDCKKLDVCRCEMSDGSGIVDLWKLDNSEGIPRKEFADILGTGIGNPYTYSFNPCTPIKTCQSNICQKEQGKSDVSCGLPDPVFTVDAKGNPVMTFKETETRTSKITLVCDNSKPIGEFENGIGYTDSSGITTYTGELSSKYSCAFPSSSFSAGIIITSKKTTDGKEDLQRS